MSTDAKPPLGIATRAALFIPLRGEYYDAFARGEKTTEYRLRGPRWNAETCTIGRRVILSRGYGVANRMTGTITGFHYDTIPSRLPGWTECYGSRSGDAACIRITVDLPPNWRAQQTDQEVFDELVALRLERSGETLATAIAWAKEQIAGHSPTPALAAPGTVEYDEEVELLEEAADALRFYHRAVPISQDRRP